MRHTQDLTEEQEQAVLDTRANLIDESFCGRFVLPEDWLAPRNPVIVSLKKESKELAKWSIVKPPEFKERYGVKSIVSSMKKFYPQWSVNEVQVIRTLKKHNIFHCDQRHTRSRPNLLQTAGDNPPDPGVVPYKPMHSEREEWKSRVQFAKHFSCIFQGKKYQGFSQFMTKVVSQGTHEKAMDLARKYLHNLKVNDTPIWDQSNEQELSRRVRDFILDVYVHTFKTGYYDDIAFVKNAKQVLKRTPMREDDMSRNLLDQARLLALFEYADPPDKQPRSCWLDAQLKESADLAEVGPGAYEADVYSEIGSYDLNPERGITIGLPLKPPPSTVPGPGAYTPREPQADKRIAPHYIQEIGGSIVEPAMQELVKCLPQDVDKAKR